MALQGESERIDVSPDMRRRLDARLGRGSGMRARVLAASVAVVLVAVGVGVWLVAGRGTVRGPIVGPPGDDTYFAGYWPVSTRAEAEAMQQRVDDGRDTDPLDAMSVTQSYASVLGWTAGQGSTDHYPQIAALRPRAVTGSPTDGWSTSVELTPQVPPLGRRGMTHIVHLVGLAGTDRPVWFVSGIESPEIVIDDPKPGTSVRHPVHVTGRARAFEGNVLTTVLDDAGRELGQVPLTAGGSEITAFEGDAPIRSEPTTPAGTVRFEGPGGEEGPSTNVTIVRVRFAEPSSSGAGPTHQPSQQALDEQAAADDAFKCFINARRARDLEAAKQCMTQRYADSITDPVEFIGPSSPSVERSTIISSARDGERIVYDALVYWGSSTGLQFVSEDTVTVVVEDDGAALVDSWTQGSQSPIGDTTTVTLRLLALGDTPKCAGETATADSFVSVERMVPAEAVIDDLALSVVRELVTGHWAHEREASSVFPSGTRVQGVSVADGVATVEMNRVPRFDTSCDHVVEALQQTLTGLDGITDVELREASTQAPSEPADV